MIKLGNKDDIKMPEKKDDEEEVEDKGLSEEQLSKLVMSYADNLHDADGILQEARINGLKTYRRDPYGDEDPNWSQVITSDVRDTVSWMLPTVLELLFGPDFPAKFAARSADDVVQAQLETEYCLNVINQQNNGFLICYTWLKDAFIQKNGYVHAFWDERIIEEREEYEGLSHIEYQKLMLDKEVEIMEMTIKLGEEEFSEEELPPNTDPAQLKYDCVVMRKEDVSQIKLINIPPEAVFIDLAHTSVDLAECHACGYETEVLVSELVEEGYDEKLFTDIDEDDELDNSEATERDNQYQFRETGEKTDASRIDSSLKKVRIIHAYIRADMDGDGAAELLYVKLAGKNGKVVLENEPVSSVRIYACTPEVECHQHFGTSVAELMEDIQRIRTVITRQVLNNLYLANHPQTAYVKGRVDYNDLITRAPGSTVGVKDTLDNVKSLVTPFVGANSLPIFEEMDKRAERRTGISETTQGLNAEALSKATNLVGTRILNAAQARILLVARIILETGFKGLFRGIHELVCQYDRERMEQIGGEWQTVDPRSWRKRNRFVIEMGPGHADKASRLMVLQSIQAIQEKIFAAQNGNGPLLNMDNIYNTLTDTMKSAGFYEVNRYFSDPKKYQPPPKDPNAKDPVSEAIEMEQMRTMAKTMSDANRLAFDKEKHEDEMALKEFVALEELKLKGRKNNDETPIGPFNRPRKEGPKKGGEGQSPPK